MIYVKVLPLDTTNDTRNTELEKILLNNRQGLQKYQEGVTNLTDKDFLLSLGRGDTKERKPEPGHIYVRDNINPGENFIPNPDSRIFYIELDKKTSAAPAAEYIEGCLAKISPELNEHRIELDVRSLGVPTAV